MRVDDLVHVTFFLYRKVLDLTVSSKLQNTVLSNKDINGNRLQTDVTESLATRRVNRFVMIWHDILYETNNSFTSVCVFLLRRKGSLIFLYFPYKPILTFSENQYHDSTNGMNVAIIWKVFPVTYLSTTYLGGVVMVTWHYSSSVNSSSSSFSSRPVVASSSARRMTVTSFRRQPSGRSPI